MDLVVNIAKTKVMVFGRETAEKNITLNEIEIENVNEFIYLGSLLTWDNNCSKEIKRRIARAMGTLGGFNKVWSSREIRLGVKLNILKTCVFSTLLYAAETWTIKKEDKDRLLSFEMKCYRRILRIRWQQKITNVEVRRRMKVTTNVMQEVIKRKMTMFGHICRMTRDRRVKKVMEGFMEGNNRRGRPRREWLQDIEAWGGKNVPTLMREAQDRNRWRIIVQCCSQGQNLKAKAWTIKAKAKAGTLKAKAKAKAWTLKAKAKAKAWTLEAKAKAWALEAKAKAKA